MIKIALDQFRNKEGSLLERTRTYALQLNVRTQSYDDPDAINKNIEEAGYPLPTEQPRKEYELREKKLREKEWNFTPNQKNPLQGIQSVERPKRSKHDRAMKKQKKELDKQTKELDKQTKEIEEKTKEIEVKTKELEEYKKKNM